MPALIAFALVVGFGGSVFTLMYRAIEGRWPAWFIMPWQRLSKNYPIARLLANSIRTNTPPWDGVRCGGLSATLGATWSWDTESKLDRATINGAEIRFNPMEARLIRRALAERRREAAETAINSALEKFVSEVERAA